MHTLGEVGLEARVTPPALLPMGWAGGVGGGLEMCSSVLGDQGTG